VIPVFPKAVDHEKQDESEYNPHTEEATISLSTRRIYKRITRVYRPLSAKARYHTGSTAPVDKITGSSKIVAIHNRPRVNLQDVEDLIRSVDTARDCQKRG
jgi:hypothetical protein